MKRIFLGWERPALRGAVDFLAARETLDLGQTIVAVPGGRAGRRLLELLVERSKAERRLLEPPQIVTLGRLPEMLYEAKRPFAEDLVQRLAWVEALKGLDPGTAGQAGSGTQNAGNSTHNAGSGSLFQRPGDDDLEAWMALGAMFARLHRELAADAVDCNAVAECGEQLEGFTETQRWRSLARAQAAYLHTLDELGLWDRQTARLFAIRRGECRVERDVVLVGLVDMNRAQRLMLDQLGGRVTALVFAPPELTERFDEYGCLKPKAWLDATIELPDDCIEVVDGPADQATAAAGAIASFDGRHSAEDIAVGVPDVRLLPHVERRLNGCGAPTRYGVGRAISLAPPYRFLADAAAYVSDRGFAEFASLVRHPHVGEWLQRQGIGGDWLTALDRFYREHLPHRLNTQCLSNEHTGAAVHKAIESLVGALDGPPRRLGEWGEPIVQLLLVVFGQNDSGGGKKFDRRKPADRQMLVACEKIHEVLRLNRELPERLAPTLSGAEAVGLVLREAAGETVAPLAERGAIELLGWLELPWDDAAAMIVTGMNEGIVPSSLNADLFLPNKLRRALGIEDNDRRYARDAYALSLLAASRSDLRLIAARRTADGDPLAPTRLFFAADEETIARRAARFFGETPGAAAGLFSRASCEKSLFAVPKPRPLGKPVESMRVTEFRDYLACPYRYYLRHRLGLESLDDAAVELDARDFGNLAHEVLRRFGESDAAASTSDEAIFAFLSGELDAAASRIYGKRPLASISVQVEQLRLRLKAFACWQAEWAAQGWQIAQVEFAPKEGEAAITVDGQPMYLRGRIDRIDVNELTGRRAVFDYKTSDAAKTPRQAHLTKGEWTDLQLPLYRNLIRDADKIEMGYIVLPKDTSKAGFLKADWSEEELREADETAARVVRAVRAEQFFPPSLRPPAFSEDFAAICQDNRIGRPLLEGDNAVADGAKEDAP